MGAAHWWVSSVRTFWGLTQAAASVSGEAAQEHGEGCCSRPCRSGAFRDRGCWPGSAPVGSILRSWTYTGNPGVSPRGASVLVLRVPGAGV